MPSRSSGPTVQQDAHEITISLTNGFQISLQLRGGYVLGLGAVEYQGHQLRNPDYTLRPFLKSLGGWRYEEFEWLGTEAEATAVRVRTRVVPALAAELEWRDCFNYEFVTLPQAEGQEPKGELIWEIGEYTEEIFGKQVPGFYYSFELRTPAQFHCYLEQGTITAARLQPATAEQQKAWDRAQAELTQFGFFTISPQRPTPGSEPLSFEGEVQPLAAMTWRAVLDEPRLDLAHSRNVKRLVQWLGDNGFERLNGEELPRWIEARIAAADAYGSVVVLPRGISPEALFFGPPGDPLWLRYLRAGGRIVHTGDLPFNCAQSPSVAPLSVNTYEQGLRLLGLRSGWGSPYWGQGNLKVTPTEAAKSWGLEQVDGAITGFALETVSLAFGVYTVPQTGAQGATAWFRNVRQDMPWSGLIKMHQEFQGDNDAALRDVWRAAHYVGQPVEIPPIPPVEAVAGSRIALSTSAGGIEGRREFVRGEQVSLQLTPEADLEPTAVRLQLTQNDTVLWTEEKPLTAAEDESATAHFTLDTSPYAYGAYELEVAALRDGEGVESLTATVGFRYIPPESFNFEIWTSAGNNPLRTDLEFADIAAHGMEVYLARPDLAGMDATTRHNLGFSLRAHADFIIGKQVSYEANPEYYRLDNEDNPVGSGLSGGRPDFGLSHPEIRENATISMAEKVSVVAGHPGFRPYVLTNDDFSRFYGWDYSPHVLADFQADTGLEAPREMVKPASFGAVPEDNPWLRWFEWTLINVDGAYNRAQTKGVVQARPDARVGPIPGGMQIPLVMLWQPSQYPSYNFGKNGFNLVCSYYYNTFWQPVMTSTFWMEIGRMGNRDLPEWNMPDCFYTAGYTRNNFYHYLAGGVAGLAYFNYGERNDSTWPEMHRLGQVVRRLGPVQARLRPAQRDLGMLNSFTTNCFYPGHTLVQVYGYHNLLQGHFDVEMVSEFEWMPAVNDLRGEWTLTATELASGRSAELAIAFP